MGFSFAFSCVFKKAKVGAYRLSNYKIPKTCPKGVSRMRTFWVLDNQDERQFMAAWMARILILEVIFLMGFNFKISF